MNNRKTDPKVALYLVALVIVVIGMALFIVFGDFSSSDVNAYFTDTLDVSFAVVSLL